ncbi:MAG: HPF/RaiA family ribosome-associated protein [Pseudomonadota bacterium]
MQIPLQISLQGLRHSSARDDAIRKKVDKLGRYYDRIMRCRVALELSARHKRHGKQLTVRVDIKVPGGEIAVSRRHDEDLRIALRDAFDAARRKLEDHARTRRGDVKRRAG